MEQLKKPDTTLTTPRLIADGYSYSLGKFRLYLDEKGELKVTVCTNTEHLQIKPSSSNSVVLIACR
jgi:hypothetical protein